MNTVAYILKGYPRISETFITSEIYRLEQLGMKLRLAVIKEGDEVGANGISNRIQAHPNYLPQTSSLSQTSLRRWLNLHLNDFQPAIRSVYKQKPRGFIRAAALAFTSCKSTPYFSFAATQAVPQRISASRVDR